MHILAISGSLRAVSKNTAILEAARLLAPPGVEITLYGGLDTLPHFNPDLDTADGRGGPDTVADWRARVARADGLLISSPEYAHASPAHSRTRSTGW
jgi:chromate reductase